ncbi:MAG: 7-cyano-7-deazaguanine synthase [Chitinophagaceae bacterium]
MSRKGKVLMAMSGGIDSTVAALMLHHEGYEVIGITMKTWDYATSGGTSKKKPAAATWIALMMPVLPPCNTVSLILF